MSSAPLKTYAKARSNRAAHPRPQPRASAPTYVCVRMCMHECMCARDFPTGVSPLALTLQGARTQAEEATLTSNPYALRATVLEDLHL